MSFLFTKLAVAAVAMPLFVGSVGAAPLGLQPVAPPAPSTGQPVPVGLLDGLLGGGEPKDDYGPEWDADAGTPQENNGDNVWSPDNNTPQDNGGDNVWSPGYGDEWN